jgi:hypothetical protein
MASLARADLETLLRTRKLDNTLASPGEPVKAPEGLPFGVAGLDRRLGGGLPRGQLSELVGPKSSGRLALLCSLMATATTQGELAALIDPLDMFDPESGAAAGIDLSRLLWVRGPAVGHFALASGRRPGPGPDLLAAALDRGLKAFNLVLQAGGFAVVGLDAGELPAWATRRVPFSTWIRLQRVLEGSPTAGVLLAREPLARSAAGVTIRLTPSNADYGLRNAEGPVAAASTEDADWNHIGPVRDASHTECPAGGRGRSTGLRPLASRWNGPPRQASLFLGIEIEAHVTGTRMKWMGDGAEAIRLAAGCEEALAREG